MAESWAPDRGDVIWIQFSPQAGHEQAGHRPALVLSPRAYNQRVGMAYCCPLTTQIKGYPFEVALPAGLPATGVVLSDQIKCLDWQVRGASFLCNVPETVVDEVRRNIVLLLEASV